MVEVKDGGETANFEVDLTAVEERLATKALTEKVVSYDLTELQLQFALLHAIVVDAGQFTACCDLLTDECAIVIGLVTIGNRLKNT